MSSCPYIPPEIIQHIAHHLTHDWVDCRNNTVWRLVPGAASYATVNKVWQDAIEREIFSEIDLRLSRLAEADAILNGNPRRRKYVRRISLRVTPFLYYHPKPLYRQIGRLPPEFVNESRRVLQATLEGFLSVLRHWASSPAITLHLDQGYRHRYVYFTYDPIEIEARQRIIELAPVHAITELEMCWGEQILSAAALCSLLAKLPALRKAKIRFQDRGLESRNELAQGLLNFTHSLDELTIDCCGYPRFPPYGANGWEEDRLSHALGIISQRVRVLCLCGVYLSTAVFLQPMSDPGIAHWARLEEFRVYNPRVCSLGEHIQFLQRKYNFNDRHAEIKHLYLAAARAALEMPLLKFMTFDVYIKSRVLVPYSSLRYYRDTRANTAKACWRSGEGFVPDAELVLAWQEVAWKHLEGKELEVEISIDRHFFTKTHALVSCSCPCKWPL
ncbi:hypothetical protein F5B22DRAFT_374476 [Xylaria bambusicola]|uniref:uncharacterized protein n=1 Tax=Xylaria bambusicola TaxID=326684 RepID=UPI002008D68A|nr:uncharacterized protein F5B22DRAFT_374476 [Xylaria bambusicola]KAI0508934.1 hypothetical protein F5B22DRAFT_374476 [Xylaria bambusicola]